MGFGFIFWLGLLGIIAGVFWLLRSPSLKMKPKKPRTKPRTVRWAFN